MTNKFSPNIVLSQYNEAVATNKKIIHFGLELGYDSRSVKWKTYSYYDRVRIFNALMRNLDQDWPMAVWDIEEFTHVRACPKCGNNIWINPGVNSVTIVAIAKQCGLIVMSMKLITEGRCAEIHKPKESSVGVTHYVAPTYPATTPPTASPVCSYVATSTIRRPTQGVLSAGDSSVESSSVVEAEESPSTEWQMDNSGNVLREVE